MYPVEYVKLKYFLEISCRAGLFSVPGSDIRHTSMHSIGYRNHKIDYEVVQTPDTPFWVGHAYIQFTEGMSWRYVPLNGPIDRFTTQDEAELHILQAAKQWIDERLGPQK